MAQVLRFLKPKGSFTGGSFRKGVRVPIGVPGGGVWGRVQVGGGASFPVENEGNRGRRWGGWGVGWGPAKEPASQCATRLSKLPFSELPFSFSP